MNVHRIKKDFIKFDKAEARNDDVDKGVFGRGSELEERGELVFLSLSRKPKLDQKKKQKPREGKKKKKKRKS